SIGRDEYLTLSYDLLNFLPRLSFPKRNKTLTDKPVYQHFLTIVNCVMSDGYRFMRPDEFLPDSHLVRWLYAYVYVFYLANKYNANCGSLGKPTIPPKLLGRLFQDGVRRIDL